MKTEDLVIIQDSKAVTTSTIVSETFGKRHADVLKSIQTLNCSPEFHERNFSLTLNIKQLPNGAERKDPEYIISRDGFVFLAMGYTGSKAAKFKEAYINAFNIMHESLSLNFSSRKELSRIELLQLALQSENERLALEAKLQSTETSLIVAESKASFADKLIQSTHTIDVGQAAKTLGLPFGRNLLFKKLREQGVFFKSKNEPMQEYVANGCFEVKPYSFKNGMAEIETLKVYVTRKGLKLISDMFGNKSNGNQLLLN